MERDATVTDSAQEAAVYAALLAAMNDTYELEDFGDVLCLTEIERDARHKRDSLIVAAGMLLSPEDEERLLREAGPKQRGKRWSSRRVGS